VAVDEAQLRALVQPMKPADIEAVMDVERLCFRRPWSPKVFLEEIARPHAYVDVIRTLPDRRLVGFVNYWLVVDEVHILNVAVHPDARRQGLARRLLEHVLAFGERQRCRLATLEVRRSNTAAQSLYRGFGFLSVGVRPAYYSDDGEDAIVMTKHF
jgi:[ribosomal protein S18]-alanine N-acetyltransferase